ncbi:MAG: uroporphyrinogen-III synthase [Kineosporiaceae bacterium]|nr:uroporphyrinogen-III synthase [Kineosporiaceae bacterium]MBK7623999.1 uroporphyrinogen-III synthase [Kineosporiaceae bacterium]MBK8075755.1 uroporphyrinogen-III synthase [Kineosporiaceae bacterium]
MTSGQSSGQTPGAGSVCFVGVGPGDEGLLTLRAVERLARADVVVVDQPGRTALIATYCRPDVQVLDAGFGDDGQPMTRNARARLVVRAARTGATVVRLLDGDPTTINGLDGEIRACRKENLPFEVVPGVSAVTAVPAYAGVVLTAAGVAGIHIVQPDDETDWSLHAGPATTLVVLGPVAALLTAVSRLLAAGRAPDTPVAVITEGTTVHQRTVTTTLAQVTQVVPGALAGPAPRRLVAVIGRAAGMAEGARWFEQRALFGWQVLVPRTKEQSAPLTALLAEHGALAQVVPTIAVEPPRSPAQFEKAITGLVTGRYRWIGFTSVNAVRAVREKVEAFGLDARAFAGVQVAAVGGVTATALRAWGIEPDLLPAGDVEQSSAGLLEIWPAVDELLDPIKGVFLPRADIATDTLVAGLGELGWDVDDVTAYRTVRAAPPPAEVREAIKSGRFDAVLFTSSSTVRNLVGIAGKPHPTTVVACIGPATAKTAQEYGLRVDVLAPEPNVAALVRALAEYGDWLRASAAEAGEEVVRPSLRRASSRRRAR